MLRGERNAAPLRACRVLHRCSPQPAIRLSIWCANRALGKAIPATGHDGWASGERLESARPRDRCGNVFTGEGGPTDAMRKRARGAGSRARSVTTRKYRNNGPPSLTRRPESMGAAHHGFRGSPDSFLPLFFVHTHQPTKDRSLPRRLSYDKEGY